MAKTTALILIILASTGLAADPGGLSLTTSLSADSIAYEDSVTLKVDITWSGPPSAYVFDRPVQPQLTGLRVGPQTSSITSSGTGDNETTTKTIEFTLLPTTSGIARVDPVTISYMQPTDSIPEQMTTDPLTVRVGDPAPPPTSGETWGWYWAIAVVLIIVVVVWRLRRQRRKVSPDLLSTPEQRFLEELTAIRQEAGDDFKKFQTGLHRILREYLRKRCQCDPDALDAEQLTGQLAESGLSPGMAERIVQWYEDAARDKYRPVDAGPGEVMRRDSAIRHVFEQM
jgi:hypothetical protein